MNTYQTVQAGLLDPIDLRSALLGLHKAIASLPTRFGDGEIVPAVFRVLSGWSHRFQVASSQTPPGDTYVAAVRGFDDIKVLLQQASKKHKTDRRLRNALAAKPTEESLTQAANLVNVYAHEMTRLLLSGPYNIFFATTKDALRAAERAIGSGAQSWQVANEIRDRLGLVHLEPVSPLQPIPLFVFEARRVVAELDPEFRIARPTTIDGFDNPRFKQHWISGGAPLSGCGLTVHLAPTFGPGLPEYVATGLPLKENFTCRYIGSVTAPTIGSDADFLEYIQSDLSIDLAAVAAALDSKLGTRARV